VELYDVSACDLRFRRRGMCMKSVGDISQAVFGSEPSTTVLNLLPRLL